MRSTPPAKAGCILAMRSAVTMEGPTPLCWVRSPGAVRPRTSTGSWRRWPREVDLREVAARPARRRAAALRRSGRQGAGRVAPSGSAAATRARRARDRAALHGALDTQLRYRYGLLSAWLLHDEVQPARQRAAGDVAGLPGSPSISGRGRDPGRARADVAAAGGTDRGVRPARVLAAAGRGLAGGADGPDAHARLLRRSRRGRSTRHDHYRRHGARHEPCKRDDGRVPAREGPDRCPRQRRRRAPPRTGERADRRAYADEPVDARALRR